MALTGTCALFADLSVVFMDTTPLHFEGEAASRFQPAKPGGIRRRGGRRSAHAAIKDYRPQLHQMIVAVIVDQNGRPVCSEMWPGNTADVTTLVPMVDRLRRRFGIGRVCMVADRGMLGPQRACALGSRSAATITALEQGGLEYILGVRERNSKEVRHRGRRYIVCRNLAEAAARTCEEVASLRARLKQGDKSLVGNSAYLRYLQDTRPAALHHRRRINAGLQDARFQGNSDSVGRCGMSARHKALKLNA